MATTLTSLQTKLNNLADETVDATKATSWINDAYKDVASRADWSWLQANSNLDTVVGTNEYSLAANCTAIYQMRTKERLLTPRHREWLFENYPNYPQYTDLADITTAYGTPTDYVFFGEKAQLYPIPEEIETVYYLYRKTITDLASGTDQPLIPEDQRGVIALGAYLKWLMADEADKYMIDQAKNDFEQAINNMTLIDQSKKNYSPIIPYEKREF